jgi:pimeloyl-ACP methyl ester carboxylesterase
MPYADLPGLRLYYEEDGAGPPLLLLNCATCTLENDWRENWTVLLSYLAQRFHIIQFDQRGTGRSTVPDGPNSYSYSTLAQDAAAMIEHLGLAPVHVAGYSEGGIVGLGLALTQPTLVRSVIGIGVNYTNDDKSRAGILLIDPDSMERNDPDFVADLARRNDPYHESGHWRTVLEWVVAANTEMPAYTVEDLRRVTVPTLWIAGENDRWFELDQPVTMKRAIPRAELLIVNDAGHGAHQSHPHLVGPAMTDFLARVDAQRRG